MHPTCLSVHASVPGTRPSRRRTMRRRGCGTTGSSSPSRRATCSRSRSRRPRMLRCRPARMASTECEPAARCDLGVARCGGSAIGGRGGCMQLEVERLGTRHRRATFGLRMHGALLRRGQARARGPQGTASRRQRPRRALGLGSLCWLCWGHCSTRVNAIGSHLWATDRRAWGIGGGRCPVRPSLLSVADWHVWGCVGPAHGEAGAKGQSGSHRWRAGAQVGATARPVAAISEKSARLELDS